MINVVFVGFMLSELIFTKWYGFNVGNTNNNNYYLPGVWAGAQKFKLLTFIDDLDQFKWW